MIFTEKVFVFPGPSLRAIVSDRPLEKRRNRKERALAIKQRSSRAFIARARRCGGCRYAPVTTEWKSTRFAPNSSEMVKFSGARHSPIIQLLGGAGSFVLPRFLCALSLSVRGKTRFLASSLKFLERMQLCPARIDLALGPVRVPISPCSSRSRRGDQSRTERFSSYFYGSIFKFNPASVRSEEKSCSRKWSGN